MTFYIVPIVEGETEVRCIEPLLQRVWSELLGATDRLQVITASRGKRGILINPEHPAFVAKVNEAGTKMVRQFRRDPSGRGMLLLLLDAETDCPATLGPRILEAMNLICPNFAISCVLAKRMFENWIVAGASTLAGVNGLPTPLPERHQHEDHSGAAWLNAQLRRVRPSRKYKKTTDAEVFVRSMDLSECRQNSPSFGKLCRDLEALTPTPTDEPATE